MFSHQTTSYWTMAYHFIVNVKRIEAGDNPQRGGHYMVLMHKPGAKNDLTQSGMKNTPCCPPSIIDWKSQSRYTDNRCWILAVEICIFTSNSSFEWKPMSCNWASHETHVSWRCRLQLTEFNTYLPVSVTSIVSLFSNFYSFFSTLNFLNSFF